jgi:hypothetical protein
VLLVVPLGYLWIEYRIYYPAVLGPVFDPLFRAVGVDHWYMALLLNHFTSWLPFVALVLASPGCIAGWKRTLRALGGGLFLILVSHFLLSWAVFVIVDAYRMSNMYYKLVIPLFLINVALPFVLWLWLYPDVPAGVMGLRWFGRGQG